MENNAKTNEMTNIEVLFWGLHHIAENHKFNADTENWEEEGQVCIWGGYNVPTHMDVQMLLEDVGLGNEWLHTSEYGFDVYIPADWYEGKANEKFEGMEMWRRVA